MRHTFTTFHYQYTKNIKKVSKKLGHNKSANTDKYVDVAEDLEEQYEGKTYLILPLNNIIMWEVSKINNRLL